MELGHKISTNINNEEGEYYYEKNTEPKIYHFIFANEGSEAGFHYNNFTLNFIENYYKMVTDITAFDIVDSIKDRFIKLSSEIIEKIEMPLTKDNFDNSDNKIIKLIKPNNIILKKCLIDELGFSNLKTNFFETFYNFYKKDNRIIKRFEATGNCSLKSEFNFHGEYTIIRLEGMKKIDKDPAKIEDNIFNSREFGNFILDIPLKSEYYLLKNELPKIDEKKGVFILEYNLD